MVKTRYWRFGMKLVSIVVVRLSHMIIQNITCGLQAHRCITAGEQISPSFPCDGPLKHHRRVHVDQKRQIDSFAK